jgi:hypothetical protein
MHFTHCNSLVSSAEAQQQRHAHRAVHAHLAQRHVVIAGSTSNLRISSATA